MQTKLQINWMVKIKAAIRLEGVLSKFSLSSEAAPSPFSALYSSSSRISIRMIQVRGVTPAPKPTIHLHITRK